MEPGARLVFTHGFGFRPHSTAFFATRPAASITEGFEVFVQLVIAAITTEPLSSVAVAPFAPPFMLMVADLCAPPNAVSKFFFTSGRFDAILRAFRPGHRRRDGGEIQIQRFRIHRIGRGVGAEEALLLGVRFHQFDQAPRRGW